MKRKAYKILIILSAVILCDSQSVKAQWYLGGGISAWYETYSYGEKSKHAISVTPEFGYSFNSHWSVGGLVTLSYEETHSNTWTIYGEKMISRTYKSKYVVNPYFRYSFFNANNFSMFIECNLGLGVYGNAFYGSLGVSPGISYTFCEHFRMTAHFGWLGGELNEYKSTLGLKFNDGHLGFSFFYVF